MHFCILCFLSASEADLSHFKMYVCGLNTLSQYGFRGVGLLHSNVYFCNFLHAKPNTSAI